MDQVSPPRRQLISICVPVFNEEDNVGPFHARMAPVLADLSESYDFEILFTDNHSEDRTFERLVALSEADPRIRVIRFSRNFRLSALDPGQLQSMSRGGRDPDRRRSSGPAGTAARFPEAVEGRLSGRLRCQAKPS